MQNDIFCKISKTILITKNEFVDHIRQVCLDKSSVSFKMLGTFYVVKLLFYNLNLVYASMLKHYSENPNPMKVI